MKSELQIGTNPVPTLVETVTESKGFIGVIEKFITINPNSVNDPDEVVVDIIF
jgi:hypothetical protein